MAVEYAMVNNEGKAKSTIIPYTEQYSAMLLIITAEDFPLK